MDRMKMEDNRGSGWEKSFTYAAINLVDYPVDSIRYPIVPSFPDRFSNRFLNNVFRCFQMFSGS